MDMRASCLKQPARQRRCVQAPMDDAPIGRLKCDGLSARGLVVYCYSEPFPLQNCMSRFTAGASKLIEAMQLPGSIEIHRPTNSVSEDTEKQGHGMACASMIYAQCKRPMGWGDKLCGFFRVCYMVNLAHIVSRGVWTTHQPLQV